VATNPDVGLRHRRLSHSLAQSKVAQFEALIVADEYWKQFQPAMSGPECISLFGGLIEELPLSGFKSR